MKRKTQMDAWIKKDGVYGFTHATLPVPKIGPGEVLVKVKAVGICGTDIGIYAGKRHVPEGLVPGHEFCGEVVEVGPGVQDISMGDLVTPGIIINCGLCEPCRRGFEAQCEKLTEYGIHVDGAFAEYIAVKATTVHTLPKGFSVVEGASIEPIAVAYNVVKKIGAVSIDRTVLVYGPGPIGLYTAQLLKLMGFRSVVVVGLVESRLKAAKKLGALTINAGKEDVQERFRKLTGRSGADVIVEATGNPVVFKDCFKMLLPHGTVVVAGIFHEPANVDLLTLVRNEYTLVGSFCYTFDDYTRATELVVDGRINFGQVVTHVLPLAELDKGFKLCIEEKAIKVIFKSE